MTSGLQPVPTCKRDWSAAGGHRRDFMVGCPLAAAAVLSCKVQPLLILLSGLFLTAVGGHPALLSLSCVLPFGLHLGCLLLTKVGVPSRLRFKEFGGVQDERLRFISRQDALRLDVSLEAGDVSRAWLVWSGAAEAALADAYRFSGGPLPSRGLVLGRWSALFRVVRLGGHKVRKARGNVSDVNAAGVFLYRNSSTAHLLVMRRRFKAVFGCS